MSGSRAIVLAAGPWHVAFERVGDRMSHSISILSGDQCVRILESIEGQPDDAWPESPPLQELQVDSRAPGQLALAVGMAGKSHWSVSVELDSAGRWLGFDVAVRLRAAAGPLGSQYRALVPVQIEDEGRTLVFEAAGQRFALQCEPLPGIDRAKLQLTIAGLTIVPIVDVDSLPCTVRWSYKLAAR